MLLSTCWLVERIYARRVHETGLAVETKGTMEAEALQLLSHSLHHYLLAVSKNLHNFNSRDSTDLLQ